MADPTFSEADADLVKLKWRLDRDGYARTTINPPRVKGRKRVPVTRRAHRIVAERMLGRPLTSRDVVDHVNFDPLDNRRENLRVVTWQQNCQHRKTRNRTGYRGVALHRATGKYQSYVRHNGKRHYCGLFATPREAGAAAAAKRAEFGFLSEARV